MSLQVNVKDLLSNLYTNRGVIELLFGQRDQITVNEGGYINSGIWHF